MKINLQTAKKWTREHKGEILLVAGTAVVVGGTAALIHFHQVGKLQTLIRVQNDVIEEQAVRIVKILDWHDEVCAMKDAAHLSLAADALRHGSSIGGEEMASWRAYLKTIEAVA